MNHGVDVGVRGVCWGQNGVLAAAWALGGEHDGGGGGCRVGGWRPQLCTFRGVLEAAVDDGAHQLRLQHEVAEAAGVDAGVVAPARADESTRRARIQG